MHVGCCEVQCGLATQVISREGAARPHTHSNHPAPPLPPKTNQAVSDLSSEIFSPSFKKMVFMEAANLYPGSQ